MKIADVYNLKTINETAWFEKENELVIRHVAGFPVDMNSARIHGYKPEVRVHAKLDDGFGDVRGALHVLTYSGTPFAVHACGGKRSDWMTWTYVTDEKLMHDARYVFGQYSQRFYNSDATPESEIDLFNQCRLSIVAGEDGARLHWKSNIADDGTLLLDEKLFTTEMERLTGTRLAKTRPQSEFSAAVEEALRSAIPATLRSRIICEWMPSGNNERQVWVAGLIATETASYRLRLRQSTLPATWDHLLACEPIGGPDLIDRYEQEGPAAFASALSVPRMEM